MELLYALYLFAILVFAAVAGTTLAWMLHAWRTPGALEQTGFNRTDTAPRATFSLIVPARHEERVLEATLCRLAALDYPDFEVLVVVGHDDHDTHEVAERVAARHPQRVSVIVDTSWPKSKPKALNAALPFCRGQIVGVFDAEDVVHANLLRCVDQCFQATGAHIVQGGTQLMNYRSSWYAVRNVLEYYFWFRSRLHFQARQRFVPLGGNTVFVWTELLRAEGGWDSACLAEDCEIGVRLASLGARTVVGYEPTLVTREETPHSLRALARQRTRWNQGFLQTLRKGDWRRLPRRRRALAVYTLAMPFLQAFAGLMIPVSMATMVLLKAPILLTLLSFVPVMPTLAVLAFELVGLREFCNDYGLRARALDYARLALGMLPYQVVLSLAAVRAVARELRGVRNWEKTSHVGAHLDRPVVIQGERA